LQNQESLRANSEVTEAVKPARRFQKRARTEEDRDLVREKIILAAEREFSMRAVEDVSMRMIAERAGYSQGTIYQYFSNRNALLIYIKREHLAAINASLEELAGKISDPRTRLERLLKAYHRYWEENPDTFKIIFSLNHTISDRRMPDGTLLGESKYARDTFFIFHRHLVALFDRHGASVRKATSYFLTSSLLSALHGSLALPLGVVTATMPHSRDMNVVIIKAILDSWESTITASVEADRKTMSLADFGKSLSFKGRPKR
jgi:AcrR family transcriptional regulator